MKGRFNPIANLILLATLLLGGLAFLLLGIPATVVVGVVGLYASLSPRMMREWERGVLLRLGRFKKILGPGINWTFPGFDRLTATVDMRIRSTPFTAEKTLTKDTVPVNVDAVLFWVVTDAERAIVEVERYQDIVSWAAQTTLRDVIGHTELVRMISDREKVDEQLQEIIDGKTTDWGITVQSVEIPRRADSRWARGRHESQGSGRPRARGAHHPVPSRSCRWLMRWRRQRGCTIAIRSHSRSAR